MPLRRILISDGTKPDRTLEEITRRAAERGVRLDRANKRELDAKSERGAHQGVLAEAEPYGFASIDQVIARAEGKPRSLIIALDHVTDPGNLGAVARSAEVVGADGVLIAKRRSAAVTPAAYKASAGALAHVLLAQEANLVRSLERCKQAGYWIAGASEHAEQTVWEAALEGRIVVVMGSEGEGLARLTVETCDFLVRLPQSGKVGSLNVAQATTAIAYEWLRRGAIES
jgi:23S rRNA (guanosine2251-2'-O)-methyltransferase